MSKSAESRETSQMQQTPTWTDRQKSCIEYSGDRLLISGPPGTGKTLVLLKRACRFSQTAPSARILVMTFNKALARYAEEQLRLNGADSAATATHFHRWAYRHVLHVLGHPPQLIAEADRIALVRHLVEYSRSQQTQQNGQQTTPTHFTRTGTEMPTVLTRSTD